MAYDLKERFSKPPKYYKILDPGAYQFEEGHLAKPNKVPFLSKTPRITGIRNKIWTHTIYGIKDAYKIPNCTAMMSKIERFPHHIKNSGHIEELICACEDPNICECETTEGISIFPDVNCQGKKPRKIFIGATFSANVNFKNKRKYEPQFYNATVKYSTDYYKGCKWSKRGLRACTQTIETSPGPAYYTLKQEPTFEHMCAERVRAYKRKTSKQLRFIEMVQHRNIIDNLPGPGSYSPKLPEDPGVLKPGPKSQRFLTYENKNSPGPAEYSIKRDFDAYSPPVKLCHARLPASAPFGVNAIRFKPRKEEGPSPASYDSIFNPCKIIRCTKAPFLISTKRFKEDKLSDDEENYIDNIDFSSYLQSVKEGKETYTPMWQFKSKTVRMKPLKKSLDEPSPADFPQPSIKVNRNPNAQQSAPFYSSAGRFRPWYNWVSIHGKENTPGPGYYDCNLPKCYPAVNRGPLFRARRFCSNGFNNPAPNEYKVENGVKQILGTHNQMLLKNVEKQHKFIWVPPNTTKPLLSYEELEDELLQKSIALLDSTTQLPDEKKKLLRCFVKE
ncbi:uncharacterized protein LOC126978932 [Leptidea sinapis]|uniref:uncharacterized protein LOC126978932 n=1 Tax=Leptidea sinapis TaxID=189913 RepID=UPI0021C3ED5F|nr:uncharacterized protein LOC126978932 [Leptidea sinapis]